MSQPDALRFADTLDQVAALFSCPAALLQSAAELRRLHAENAALKSALNEPDALTVNFMRQAGIDKHAARKCADVVRDIVESAHCIKHDHA